MKTILPDKDLNIAAAYLLEKQNEMDALERRVRKEERHASNYVIGSSRKKYGSYPPFP